MQVNRKLRCSEVHQNDCVEMMMMMMEQKGLESKRLRTVAGPAVSSHLHSTLMKVKSTENEDDSGTKNINGSRH